MAQAKSGDRVAIHYTGTLSDNTTFDSSRGREPLVFELGSGQVIPGFEQGVMGMEPGDTKKVTIPADQAYGERRDDLVLQVGRDQVPPDVNPEVGDQLQIQQANGQPIPVTVTEVTDEHVTLDANHPLAGQELTFEIELVEIQ